ncbi:MAG: integrin alpha [Planctomycetes bacterium]|nr:integrin alpha [Planctomycetota bacterium]
MDGIGANQAWGASVSGTGDVNGDGAPDVLVGAPGAYGFWVTQPGRARIFSGADGTVLRTFLGTNGDQLGKSVSRAGDVDGDGTPDVAIGAPTADVGGETDAGVVRIHSGASGALLSTLTGSLFSDLFGTSVAGAGDVNADGIPDLVVAAPYADPGGFDEAGQVKLLSVAGIPPGSTPFGTGCAGTGGIAPSIAAFGGPPGAGNPTFGLAVTRGLGGAPALLFLGSLPYPAGLPLGGCSLHLDGAVLAVPPPAFLSGPFGSAGAGHRLQGLPIPGDPALVGASAHFQWAVLDLGSPNGLFTTSDALSVTVF